MYDLRWVALLTLLWLGSLPPATRADADTGMMVWGVAYRQLIEYPEHQLTSPELVDVLIEARNRYPMRMTLEQINSVADAATRLYRERGYKFHYVYVPPQKPNQGLIEFEVVVATLGDIQVVRAEGVSPAAVEAVFHPFLGKPLYQPDIDQAMLALKQQAGVDAVAYYSRGSQPGQVRLNIKLAQQGVALDAHLDNYGSESTGQHRALMQLDWLSPTGRFDQLSAGLMVADGDDVNLYGYLSYRTPLWNLDNEVELSVSNNQFGIGRDFSNLELNGDARIADFRYRHTLTRSPGFSQRVDIGASWKATDYDSIFNDPDLEQDETASGLTLGWDGRWQPSRSAMAAQLALQLSGGQYQVDGVTGGDDSFGKLLLSHTFQLGMGAAGSRWRSVLATSIRGQYSDDALPSFEKLLLSGAYGVRAYRPGFFAAERGALASVNWYFPGLFGDGEALQLTPFLFVDGSYGEKLNIDSAVLDRAILAGAGVGLDLTLFERWYLQLLGATSLEERVASQLEPETMDVFFQLNYRLD